MSETCIWPFMRPVTIQQSGKPDREELRREWASMGWWKGQPILVELDESFGQGCCEQHELFADTIHGHPSGILSCTGCNGFTWAPEGPEPCTWADCWHHGEPDFPCTVGCACARRTPAAAGGEP